MMTPRILSYHLIFLTLLSAASTAVAGNFSSPSAAQFYYTELYPRQGFKLEVLGPTGCLIEEPFEQFQSQVRLRSETGKRVTVRIIHLYAKPHAKCSSQPKGLRKTHSFEIKADSRRMTHVYLTSIPDWKLEKTD